MNDAQQWFIARIGYVETLRALSLAASARVVALARDEWATFEVVELDQRLAERAVELAAARRLRSLDAVHLAAALTVADDELEFASWDERLSAAAAEEGLALLRS